MAAPVKAEAFHVDGGKPDKSGAFGDRLQKATGHFKKILNRDPTEAEVARIGNFISAPNNSVMVLMNNDGVTTHEIKKDSSERYSLYFQEKKDSAGGNWENAVKWFKKFNKKDPTEEEMKNLKQFMGWN